MKRDNVNGIFGVVTLKRNIFMSIVIICMMISIEGCITSDSDENPEVEPLENPLILTIASEKTTYTMENNLTIPITVEIENIDDVNYTIHEISMIRSTLHMNVTNSDGQEIFRFFGFVDSPPNEITIEPHSKIQRELVIGGWGFQSTFYFFPPLNNHFYFNETGEYTFNARYQNWDNMGQERLFNLFSNPLVINIHD